jgi:hypothetical protein
VPSPQERPALSIRLGCTMSRVVGDEDTAASFDRSATNGFRCVRYTDPDRALRDFGNPAPTEHWPDY